MSVPVTCGWTIRRAVEAEIAEVVVLERETATAPHWAWAEYGALLDCSQATDGGVRRCLFVAAEGRVISGFAVGKAQGSGRDAEAELESVVVRDEARRQGLGSALCRAVMEWSRGEGAQAIALEVRAGSAGAIRLYGGLGFVATGRRPAYYHGPVEDAIVMRCGLSGSSSAERPSFSGQKKEVLPSLVSERRLVTGPDIDGGVSRKFVA